MADINRATIMGRLGSDPEIRTTQNGDKIANLSVATSEQWKDKASGEKRERTEWHRVSVFGPMADVAERYLRKGARVVLEGKIQTRKWQDQSGQDRYSTEINVSGFGSRLDVIDWPESGSNEGGYSDQPQHSAPQGGGASSYDDEIPF